MKSNGKHEATIRSARESLVLAALLAMVLSTAGISRAQSSTSSPETPGAKTVAAPTKAPDVPAAKPPAKGQHDGVTVHGHWVIEVKNPDGKLVRHVEFENSLDPGFLVSVPAGKTPIPVPGGAALLGALLTSQATPATVGPWAVMFVGPSGLGNLGYVTNGNAPCLSNIDIDPAVSFGYESIGACFLFEGTSSVGGFETCGVAGIGVFCGLTATPSGAGLVLSGSATPNQQGQISTVATLFFTGAPSIYAFESGTSYSFTSSTNFPGAPISVSKGQTIAVTVGISFQ